MNHYNNRKILFIDTHEDIVYNKEVVIFFRSKFFDFDFWLLNNSDRSNNIKHFFDEVIYEENLSMADNFDIIAIYNFNLIEQYIEKINFEKVLIIEDILNYSLIKKDEIQNYLEIYEKKENNIFMQNIKSNIIKNINSKRYDYAFKLCELLDNNIFKNYYKAIIYLKKGEEELAKKYFIMLTEKYDSDYKSFYISAYYNLYKIYKKKNDNKNAEIYKLKCLELAPEHKIKRL
ncbi:MAG TPA: hypothetical protein PKX90_10230 [bacterium]|nr:hypothetical protein [bacterium]